jgi:hypothetical protein
MQAIPFQAPMGLGELLDRAFRLYRARFGKLVLTTAIFFVPLGLLSAVLMGATMGSYFDILFNAVDQPAAFSESEILRASGATILVSLLVSGAGLMLGALAFLSLLAQAEANVMGGELPIGVTVRAALSRFWPFVGMALLVALIAFGVVIAIYFVLIFVTIALTGLFAAFATVTDNSGIAAVGAAILLIMLIFAMTFLLLLPFAYLSARWLIAPVVVLVERCGPTSALSRSWRLTAGSFWRLFGLLVLLVILNSVVLGLPLTLLQFLTIAVMTPQIVGVLNGVLTGVSYLVSILWYPFLALTLLLVYYDLRVRKENYDLLLRIQALEESVRPTTLPTS